MIYLTSAAIDSREIMESLGTVRGSTVSTRNIGSYLFAWLQNIVGGEISDYIKLMAQSREQAIKRMLDETLNV